jgi:hypothetical protein
MIGEAFASIPLCFRVALAGPLREMLELEGKDAVGSLEMNRNGACSAIVENDDGAPASLVEG